MSRLINADELFALIKPITDEDTKWACTGADAKALIVKSITDAPTVDAVPVVHCKDCKHYAHKCRVWLTFGEDDYCSYGERKDDEDS